MKAIDKNLMHQVLQALGWNEQQYAEFIEQCGHAYLHAFIKGYDMIVNEIISSKSFWNWWKLHWQKREMEFIETITDYPESVTDVAQLYKDTHDAEQLAGGMYLNGQVLQESYISLIDEITKEQTITKTVHVCQI